MAVTITGETILATVMQRGNLGVYLANAEIGSIAAGSVTSVFHLRNVQYSSLEFRDKNALLFRPGNATGMADYVRAVGDLTASSGALANDANWADTTLGTENVYIMYDRANEGRMFTPRQFLDALNQAMRKVFFDTQEPGSMKPSAAVITDAGFQISAVTSYVESDADGGAATTFTKVSTTDSENVFPGRINGGRVVNTQANGYIRQRFSVTEGETLNVWSLTRLDSGTNVELHAYDVTQSAEIGSDAVVEHDQEAWQYMYRQIVVPSGCKIVEIRHQGEGASDDFYIAGQWVYKTNGNMLVLDSTWESNEFRMPSLARIHLGGTSVASNVHDAFSSKLEAVQEGDDTYHFLITPPAANPYAIQIHDRSLFSTPLVIQGRRAYSDLTTFTLALSETTACPLDLIEAKTRLELFGPNGALPDPARFAQAQIALSEQEIHPRLHSPARRRPEFFSAGLRS